MSITIKSGAKVLYQWERGVALTASTPCDILRISREDDRVTDDLYPVISGSTGTALIPDRMLTESGYLHVSRIDHADGSERVLETVRILVRHAAKPQNTASSTKEIDDMQTIRMQMAALERAAREGKFDGKDGTTPHIGENGNWFAGNVDLGIRARGEKGDKGDPGDTPHIGENGNWFIGDEDTGVFARNEDVSLYADDMFTSGILEKGAMPLKILEPSGSNVIRYEIESAVVYIKGIRRARGGFTTSTQAVSFERLFANILRLNVEKGTFSWRVAEVTRDGDNFVNIDNGEIYPARSGGYYDLIPYLVHVPAGATAITYDMVEDLRADERYCGYVRDRLAPEKVSELENDAGYVTDDQIENVITTEPQDLTDAEKAQARANIGAATVGEVGGKANGIIDTATGEVIALTDSAEAPLSGLVVYGKSTQDGTPTPDAPVPIVSVGEDGVTDVGVYGANLIRFPYHSQNNTSQGITWTINEDGSVTANGTATANSYFALTNKIEWYSTSFNVFDTPKTINGITFSPELNYNSNNQQLYVTVASGETVTNKTFYPMANYGNTLKPYEPYKPAQTLPVSTPDGLCGIPVTSGGNYTDASGQQWVCDEIDFVRGVRVQRVGEGYITNKSNIWIDNTETYPGRRYVRLSTPSIAIESAIMSDSLTYNHYKSSLIGLAVENAGISLSATKNDVLYFNIAYMQSEDTVEATKEVLAQYTLKYVYALKTPIETPLTEEELAAYRALQTNYPNTTIYADDNAGLSVGYSADTKHYIDKKFAELAAAIVNN